MSGGWSVRGGGDGVGGWGGEGVGRVGVEVKGGRGTGLWVEYMLWFAIRVVLGLGNGAGVGDGGKLGAAGGWELQQRHGWLLNYNEVISSACYRSPSILFFTWKFMKASVGASTASVDASIASMEASAEASVKASMGYMEASM